MSRTVLGGVVAVALTAITSCEPPPPEAGAKAEAAKAPAPKPPHPDHSHKSAKYSPTVARHVTDARVVAVGADTLTLFLDTNYAPLDAKGWQVRQFPVVDMLARGDIHEWAGDIHAYGLADLQVNDIVDVGVLKDVEDGQVYVYEISIHERPGNLVPPSRRPGWVIHCPPNQKVEWAQGPWHVWKNVANDLKAGRPVPEALLRQTGRLPPLEAVPSEIPSAKD